MFASCTFGKEGAPHQNFSNIFRVFRNLFVRFVLSKIFQKIGCAETIRLVRKSSKSELSSRFFGRLNFFKNFDVGAARAEPKVQNKWLAAKLSVIQIGTRH